MPRKAGLPPEGGEGASTTETKKGRGPAKSGVFVEFSSELASEIKATANRMGNGSPAHTKLAHADINALIARAHQEFSAGHLGKVASMYFDELKRRAENPQVGVFQ